jgi:hypothetical protein
MARPKGGGGGRTTAPSKYATDFSFSNLGRSSFYSKNELAQTVVW